MHDKHKKHTILFVDDDNFFLDLYSQKAKQYNIVLKIADSAPKAIERLKELPTPDAVVVDIDMPGMNGFELIENIQEKNLAPDAKIVILTNKNEPYYIEKARKYSVALYIVKAARVPSQVLSEVFELLDRE